MGSVSSTPTVNADRARRNGRWKQRHEQGVPTATHPALRLHAELIATRGHGHGRIFSQESNVKVMKKMGAVLALSLAAAGAMAAGYPDKPVHVIVTTVPGPLDAFARVITAQLQARL